MLNKTEKEKISIAILDYLNDTDNNPIDDSKKYKNSYSSYIGPMSSFIDFSHTVYDGFISDFENYLKDILDRSIAISITNIGVDNIEFKIDSEEALCFIDSEFLMVEWTDKNDK